MQLQIAGRAPFCQSPPARQRGTEFAMRLYVMRHGVAMDRHDPAAPSDPERPLTADGSERTRLAVLGLVRLGVHVERVLTSPHLRAVQTAAIAAEPLGVTRANVEALDALAPEQPVDSAVAAIEASGAWNQASAANPPPPAATASASSAPSASRARRLTTTRPRRRPYARPAPARSAGHPARRPARRRSARC